MGYKVLNKYISTGHSIKNICKRYIEAKYRIQLISKYKDISKSKILDFGCGSGEFIGYISENTSADVYLYDPSKNSLKRAKKLFLFKQEKLFQEIDSFKKHKFDIITILSVYKYIPDKRSFWQIMLDRTKIEGLLFIEVYNPKSLYRIITRQKFDIEWKINKKEVPKGFKLIKVVQSPVSNELFTFLDYKKSTFFLLFNLFIFFIGKITRTVSTEIYIYQRI
jgi:2-polyprenyl-3-methyl-5-hydroxy-6-metoxy-1,4-benzoquinol methylase